MSPLQQQIEDVRANFETRISNLEGKIQLIAGMLGEKLTIELPQSAVNEMAIIEDEIENSKRIKTQVNKIING